MTMTTSPVTARELYGALIGQHVIVTFSDGGTEAGVLEEAAWDTLAVLQTEGRDQWQALYALAGDEDTPHVVCVALDQPQTEALF